MSISFEPKNTQFSLQNAYALALCANLAYEDEKTIQDQVNLHGFNSQFIERRDIEAFIAYSDSAIVLSFRGTDKIKDWMTNSDLLLTSAKAGTGKVHGGFLRALCLVWNDILEILDEVQKKAQPLWITGHSLGGALATLAAARFVSEMGKPVAGVYTFGQPRTGDREFCRIFNADLKQRFFRFVNNSDIVTRIPPRELGYGHVGLLRFFDADGNLFDDISWWQEFLESIKGTLRQHLDLIPSNIEYHSMECYIKNIHSKLINPV
ncbi:MAG: lipase family protein [Pseudomonadota bacterium]|nr:lipase family protein [Pseudomonadota bacterium]